MDGKDEALVDDEAAERSAYARGAEQSENVTAWPNLRHSESQDRASSIWLACERLPMPDLPDEDEGRMPERTTDKPWAANPCAAGPRLRRALSRNHEHLHHRPRPGPEITARCHLHHGAWASFAWTQPADADVCGGDGPCHTGGKGGHASGVYKLHPTSTNGRVPGVHDAGR
jgi:hypothetical protein